MACDIPAVHRDPKYILLNVAIYELTQIPGYLEVVRPLKSS